MQVPNQYVPDCRLLRLPMEWMVMFAVCRDVDLVRSAPMIVQRTLKMLGESKRIWPIVSRWHEHLGTFYQAHHNLMGVGLEGSMADSVSWLNSGLERHRD